jgi:hypothetical protein
VESIEKLHNPIEVRSEKTLLNPLCEIRIGLSALMFLLWFGVVTEQVTFAYNHHARASWKLDTHLIWLRNVTHACGSLMHARTSSPLRTALAHVLFVLCSDHHDHTRHLCLGHTMAAS